jgi:transposase
MLPSAIMVVQHFLVEAGMARRTGRAPLVLGIEQRSMLEELVGSRTASMREVERAKVLLAYAQGKAPTEIQRLLGVSRPTIYKCIDKALAAGVNAALRDRFHPPHTPQISDEAKAWVIDLACRKPNSLGMAAELWTLSALAAYVASYAAAAGFPRLSRAGKTTVWRILDAHDSSQTTCATTSNSTTRSSNARHRWTNSSSAFPKASTR